MELLPRMQCTCRSFHHKRVLWLGRGQAWSTTRYEWTRYIWPENIKAHTRPSAATRPAPTNRTALAAAMESKANANFIMSKGLTSWKSSRELTVLAKPLPSFIAKPAYRIIIINYRDNKNDLWEMPEWKQASHDVLWKSRRAGRRPK